MSSAPAAKAVKKSGRRVKSGWSSRWRKISYDKKKRSKSRDPFSDDDDDVELDDANDTAEQERIIFLENEVSAQNETIRQLRAQIRELQFDPSVHCPNPAFPAGADPALVIPLPPLLPPVAPHAIGVEARATALEECVEQLRLDRVAVRRANGTAKKDCEGAYHDELQFLESCQALVRKRQESELRKFDKEREQLVRERDAERDRLDAHARDWLARSLQWIKKAEEEIARLRGVDMDRGAEKEGVGNVQKQQEQAHEDDELRQELCCPLTHEVMQDPVMTVNGQTYERSAIEEWFLRFPEDGGNPRCPKSNEILASRSLISNVGIRSLCEVYRRRYERTIVSQGVV